MGMALQKEKSVSVFWVSFFPGLSASKTRAQTETVLNAKKK